MNNTAEIYLWGSRIGIIHQDPDKTYASFEYDKSFQKSGIELSPLRMPLSSLIYQFPALANEPFFGLPGLVADSLPDKFGNAVIEQWLHSQGKSINDFTAIDRLCYTGTRGMGALEYVPAISDTGNSNEEINVSAMVKFASDVLSAKSKLILNAEEKLSYAQLVQIGSSAGGARAKAVIAWDEKNNIIKSGQLNAGENFDYWLMKFGSVENNGDYGLTDTPQYTLIEYAYYKMATACGIEMSECRLYSSDGLHHFMTKRFDRKNGEKIHMQSLGALAHLNYNEPCACSYELAAHYMKAIGLSAKEIAQFFRRMVFNCLAVNQDDHVKNISFLMDKSGKWTLAPAYDLTFSYNQHNRWLKAHQMTINNKNDNIQIEDLIDAGKAMGLKERLCKEIINDVQTAVNNFRDYACIAGLSEQTYQAIQDIISKKRL